MLNMATSFTTAPAQQSEPIPRDLHPRLQLHVQDCPVCQGWGSRIHVSDILGCLISQASMAASSAELAARKA